MQINAIIDFSSLCKEGIQSICVNKIESFDGNKGSSDQSLRKKQEEEAEVIHTAAETDMLLAKEAKISTF